MEAERDCMRATKCGKEARSLRNEPMNKNRIEGVLTRVIWPKTAKLL